MSAQILPFIPRAKAGASREAGVPPAVIIFPGVRYERLRDEEAFAPALEPAAPRH